MWDFNGASVVVAGGNGLIGSPIVRAFREAGATVTNVDIDMEGEGKAADLTDPQEVERVLKECDPAVFVNATYPKDWLKHAVCFKNCTYLTAKHMARRGGGAIVNLSSIYGVVSPDFRSYREAPEMGDIETHAEYSFVKAGIIAMTRTVAVAHANKFVRANCIAPGGVYDKQSTSFVADYVRRTPMLRMANTRDVIGAVLFLASPEASYITGQTLICDGGLTAW